MRLTGRQRQDHRGDVLRKIELSKAEATDSHDADLRAVQADRSGVRAQRLTDAEQSGDLVEILGLAGLGQAEAASIKLQ